ncbi:MAG: 2OG-Fe(II) oxygenase [Oculatellaceae cyanobacterium bins.114]|nr:2OG-Fe(II) oxygenase [Oculatellaceae cyanobacterium bins.114]
MSSKSQATHKSQVVSSEDIKVTILLTGGHDYTVMMPPDAALLRQLFEVVLDQTGSRAKMLFQVPIQKGRSMLCFPGEHLVGLVTEPPLVVQQQPQTTQTTQIQAIQTATPTIEQPSEVLPSSYVQLDQFFTTDELTKLLSYTFQKEAEFVSTSTSTGDLDYRKSVVLHSFPEFSNLISRKISAIIPDILTKLGIPQFPVSQIESQLTGHNDGNYYKIHNDNGSPDTATRELTYVYYFYREPKAFSGGELLIYDSRIENNFYVQAESFHTIEPRNNSIVFFLSRYMHEVLPIQCPSRAFVDSRFTINGWIRR